MSYWSKQIIAREVELEKMRRAKPKVAEKLNPSPRQQKVIAADKALPNFLQQLIPKPIKSAKPNQIVGFIKHLMKHELTYDFFLRFRRTFLVV